MTDVTTDAPPCCRGIRKRWEELRQSDTLKDLLKESALWTALWTGFPLSDELDRAQVSASSPKDRVTKNGGARRIDGKQAKEAMREEKTWPSA